jgi:hypothetical protein
VLDDDRVDGGLPLELDAVGSDSSTVSRVPRLPIGTIRLSASSLRSISSGGIVATSSAAMSISGRPKVSAAKWARRIGVTGPPALSWSMNFVLARSAFFWTSTAWSSRISLCCTSARASPDSTTLPAAVGGTAVAGGLTVRPPSDALGSSRRQVWARRVPVRMRADPSGDGRSTPRPSRRRCRTPATRYTRPATPEETTE